VEAADFLFAYVVSMERRRAEKALEAAAGDFAVAFVMNMTLVVIEEHKFLFRECIRFQCHFESMIWFQVRLFVGIFALVNCGDQVERILLLLLLPADVSSVSC
jgi:hypothetical protein